MIPDRDKPTAIDFDADELRVTLANGRQIAVPLANYPQLLYATADQRTHVQLGLSGIYWPDLQLELSLLELLTGSTSTTRSHKPRFCEG